MTPTPGGAPPHEADWIERLWHSEADEAWLFERLLAVVRAAETMYHDTCQPTRSNALRQALDALKAAVES